MVKSRAAAPRRAKAQRTAEHRDDTQRIAEMIDLAAGAKMIADNLGERFLAYLLAMVIQEMSHIDSRRASRQAVLMKRARDVPPAPKAD